MTKEDLANMYNNVQYLRGIEGYIDDEANKNGLAVFYGKSWLLESVRASVSINGEEIFYKSGEFYTINGWNQDIPNSTFRIWEWVTFLGIGIYKKTYCKAVIINIYDLENKWTNEPVLDFNGNIICKKVSNNI